MKWMKKRHSSRSVAAFIATHPIYEERIVIAEAWAQVLAGMDKRFDRDIFLSACGIKYENPPLEEA